MGARSSKIFLAEVQVGGVISVEAPDPWKAPTPLPYNHSSVYNSTSALILSCTVAYNNTGLKAIPLQFDDLD